MNAGPPESLREAERFPSGLQAAFIVLGLFVAEMLVDAVLYDSRGLLGLGPDDASALVTLLGNAIVFVIVLQHKRIGYRQLFQPGRSSIAATVMLTSLPIVLLVPLLVVGLTTAIGLVAQLFPPSAADQSAFERLASGSLPVVVSACLLAPVLEEMLFRGIFLRSFLRRHDRATAIVMSSALFGLAHLNVYQFVAGFGLGLLAGWLYERTQSLLPCIVLHASYNCAVIGLGLWLRGAGAQEASGFSAAVWLLAAGAGLAGTLALRRLLLPRRAAQRA
jgi:hypothetical protein